MRLNFKISLFKSNGAKAMFLALATTGMCMATPTVSAASLKGQVLGAGAPIGNSTVTLWAAGTGATKQLAQVRSGADGRFTLTAPSTPADSSLYLVAQGGQPAANKAVGNNPAIALMSVLGSKLPTEVTINEMTTVASVWTNSQFLNGTAIHGPALGLRIAAGNVPNLVCLKTGGLGQVIQDPLNSSQTATLATFNTLANLLAGCVTRVHADACNKLFDVATPPGGVAPTDTLTAAQNIARNPSNQAHEIFALLDAFYPVPAGKRLRPAPFIPYLSFAPPAWTLSLVYAGGGLNSLGGIDIDAEGNLWAADNFLVGSQSTIYDAFGGGVSKIASNGQPISPMTFGYRGGGIDTPGFGLAIGAERRDQRRSDEFGHRSTQAGAAVVSATRPAVQYGCTNAENTDYHAAAERCDYFGSHAAIRAAGEGRCRMSCALRSCRPSCESGARRHPSSPLRDRPPAPRPWCRAYSKRAFHPRGGWPTRPRSAPCECSSCRP